MKGQYNIATNALLKGMNTKEEEISWFYSPSSTLDISMFVIQLKQCQEQLKEIQKRNGA